MDHEEAVTKLGPKPENEGSPEFFEWMERYENYRSMFRNELNGKSFDVEFNGFYNQTWNPRTQRYERYQRIEEPSCVVEYDANGHHRKPVYFERERFGVWPTDEPGE